MISSNKNKKYIVKGNNNNKEGITNVVKRSGQRTGRRFTKTTVMPMRLFKNIQSSRKFQAIKYPDTIQSINASPNLNFTSTTAPYLNLSTIFGVGSFQANMTIYNLFRIVDVKVDVNRVITEFEVDSVYTAGTLSPVYVIFAPNFTSTTPSGNELQSSVAFEVDPFVTVRQTCVFEYSPILAYNNSSSSSGNIHLFGMWNVLSSNYTNMPGQLGIFEAITASTATGVHLLYQITVTVDCEFSFDYP